MTHDEILNTFLRSARTDWSDDLGTPTFLYAPADAEKQEVHYSRIVYKPNIAIAVASGLTVNDRYQDEWLERYPDKGPGRSFWIDLLYNGQVVHRELGVSVDGGRYVLPPGIATVENDQITGWCCRRDAYEFVEAFARATGETRSFETGFKISGMTID